MGGVTMVLMVGDRNKNQSPRSRGGVWWKGNRTDMDIRISGNKYFNILIIR